MEASKLMSFKRWAVVGDVLNSTKYAYKILHALQQNEYEVVGVNPRETSEAVYKTLKDISHSIEVIDLCINPSIGIEIIKEAKTLQIDKVLIQPGAESEEILHFCRENNIHAVEGCALVELSRKQV